MFGLKPGLISEANATTKAEATAKASATAKANTGVLHCVQDDECMGDAGFCKNEQQQVQPHLQIPSLRCGMETRKGMEIKNGRENKKVVADAEKAAGFVAPAASLQLVGWP